MLFLDVTTKVHDRIMKIYQNFKPFLTYLLFSVFGVLVSMGSVRLLAQCAPNIGFEQNSFAGWTGYTGLHTGTLPVNTPTVGIVAGRHTVTTGGNDAVVAAIPQVCPIPGFGARSVRLGNQQTGRQAERLVTSFTVTPNTSALLFAFAVILQDPGHSIAQQPRFELAITLPNNQNLPCGNYVYVAGNNLPGFQNQGSTRWRQWAQQSINLIPFIGQTVNVNVMTADCSASGHYGYGYFDMTCDIFQVIRRYCPGDQDAILTAPSGFTSYQWSPTGQTTQSILVQNPVNNSVYSVTMIPLGGNPGCSVTINDTIRLMGANTSVVNNTCNGALAGSASIVVTGGTPFYNYTWSTNPVQTTSTATGLAAGTYSAQITDAAQCTVNVSVTLVDPPPIANTTTSTPVSCFGGSNGTAGITMIGGSPPFTYAWNSTPVQNTSTATGLTVGTWTVAVSDQGGCTNNIPIVVSGPTELTTSVNSVPVRCNGASTGAAQVTAQGGTGNLSYSWNTVPPQLTATASNIPAGTYDVTVTDANNCVATNQVVVTEPTAITSTTTFTPVSCFGGTNGTAEVTPGGGVGGFTYSWNTNPPQTTPVALNLAAQQYTVTVMDANGCIHTNTATPTGPTELMLTVTSTPASCFGGADGTVSATAQDGTPGYAYAWNTNPVQVSDNINGLSAGTYIVTVTDANGCFKTAPVVVTQPTLLTLTQSFTAVTCFGGVDGTATVMPNAATPPYTYLWLTAPNQTTQTATGLSIGTYRVMVRDANNCEASILSSVTEPPPISVSATGTDALCFGSADGTVTANGAGGTPAYNYTWSSVPPQNTQTAVGLTRGTYQVTMTDANNCRAETQIVIGEPTQLEAVTSYVPTLCFGSSDGSATVEAYGATPAYSYAWNTVPVQNAATAVGLGAGNYTVTITDAQNCSIQRQVTVTQPTEIQLTTSFTAPLCYGGSDGTVHVTAQEGTPGYTYSWNTIPTQNTQQAVFVSAGTWTVVVRDLHNCPMSAQVVVTQPDPIDIQLTKQDVLCFGQSNGSVTAQGIAGTAPYLYAWQIDPPQNTPTASNLPIGNYTVRVTDMNGCNTTKSMTVGQPDLLEADSEWQEPTCSQGTDGFARVITRGGTQPYTYMWNNNPALNQATLTNIHYGWHFALTIDKHGCARKDSMYVTQPLPVPRAMVAPDTICPGESAYLQAVSPVPGHLVHWYETADQTMPFFTGTAHRTPNIHGQRIYFVNTEDSKGCKSPKVPVIAVVHPQPIANFESDKQKWQLPDAIFTFKNISRAPAGLFSSTWDFGDGTISNLPDPVHQYSDVGVYDVKLSIVDSNGCTHVTEKKNFVEVELLVGVVPPNAFSPNGDGANDFFYIESSNMRNWYIIMLDRWGNKVYESTDLNFRWDGTNNGQPVPEGLYIYQLTGMALDGHPVERTGTVTLIR